MSKKISIIIGLLLLATMPAVAQRCFRLAIDQSSHTGRPDGVSVCTTQGVYRPLSARDKFGIFLHRTYSPYTFASTAFNATWAQMVGQWYKYGGGMQGWGKRFGATLADSESRSFIQTFALSSLLHQDPRYFPSCKKGLIPRAWYAGTRVLIAKTDQDKPTFNTAEVLGTVSVSALENAYYPEQDRGFSDTMVRFVGAIGSDATTNLLREFWPDIKRIFRKHEPDKIRKIEEKIFPLFATP
jgi:hypothetical protein